MAKIIAPVKGFTGESFGVAFSNGVGETEDRWLIQRFKDFGYGVEGDSNESGKAKATSGGSAKTTKSKA